MCGLIGIINKTWDSHLSVPTESLFKQLIYVGTLRGADSTGIWKVTKDHKTEIVKKAAPGGWFIGIKEAKDLIDNYWKDSIAVFAHNRKATMGSKDDQTAQPFKEGEITLMHNGTLTSWVRHGSLSDSHYITKLLAEEKREFKPLEALEGAYALIWHNEEKKQINFARNSERPLFLVEAKDWYILVSEAEMAEWILLRNGHDVLNTTEIQAGFVYKLSWKNNKLNLNKAKFTPYKPKFKKTTSYSYGSLYEDDDDFGGFPTAQKTPTVLTPVAATPYVPPTTTSPHNSKTEETLTVFPTQAVRIVTSPGGLQKWAGFGPREERREITGHILFPLRLLNKPFILSILESDFDNSIMNKQCSATYNYRDGYDRIRVKDIEHFASEIEEDDEVDPVGAIEKKEISAEDAWLTTKNHFSITEENWDQITACKCSNCRSTFRIEEAEQSVIIPLYQKVNGKSIHYGYKYICADCLPVGKSKLLMLPQKKTAIVVQNPLTN
jgi:hypothetical protein